MLIDDPYVALETLIAVIARSPIVVAAPAPRRRLPLGFDDVDVAVLDWIAAESRRMSRRLLAM